MLNIVFMGTPDFAKESLELLNNKKHKILAVFTAPDKPKGRGMKFAISDVKKYALEQNFKIYEPEKIKNNEEIINEIKKLNPDIICTVAYGMLLPKEVLEVPKLGAVNVHASLLPKYRGASPIQSSIINGDTKTGVTIMYMDEKMDCGDIILQEETSIYENETARRVVGKVIYYWSKFINKVVRTNRKWNCKKKKTRRYLYNSTNA